MTEQQFLETWGRLLPERKWTDAHYLAWCLLYRDSDSLTFVHFKDPPYSGRQSVEKMAQDYLSLPKHNVGVVQRIRAIGL